MLRKCKTEDGPFFPPNLSGLSEQTLNCTNPPSLDKGKHLPI